ncbi:MAG: molecular chaperone HtpG [Gammaproteobacteria bacterium]|nr:molecular chaperone HtpG [Gammaproteobacteria bacterium]
MTIEEQSDKQTLGFQTEVRQLLDLMIRSLYSNKEIFLRELISNASDAADRLRFEALSDGELYEGDGDLKIRVRVDKEARTICVSDNGIGMTRQEALDNLGTIARSGTQQFFAALSGDQTKDAQLIGQFGVGFYSSFIVAERVTVTSRRAGAPRTEAVRWESTGEGEFTVQTIDRARRGTEVKLHLREGEDEFLDGWRLRAVVRKYSDHISLPIVMDKDKSGDDDEGGEETVNSATALWTKAKNEISDEQYDEFYKHVAHDFEAPLLRLHSKVEGNLEYTSLLFIPARAPFDLWDRSARHGVKLYVRRVFIMDDAEKLMPNYLRFVRGVVDSSDLPLNVSREILQNNRQIDSMRNGSVRKILSMLESTARDDSEKYYKFWSAFGRVLKEGIIEDHSNREAIAKLCRFASTHDEKAGSVSLEQYVERMRDGQNSIYYITADSVETARNSPHLEIFGKHDVEVLFLTDEVDEWLVAHLTEFDGKSLKSITKGDLDLAELGGEEKADDDDDEAAGDEGDKSDTEAKSEEHSALVARVKSALGDRVKEVRVTQRLVSSPACLVADEHEMGAHMERILKAAGQDIQGSKPIMEINAEHALVRRLGEMEDGEQADDWVHLLYGQAVLSEGGQLDDGAGFVRRLNRVFDTLSASAS